jgi:hypothetical protein|tara:strand:+ start:1498 stop:1683 length:186 start_codon:yes stop_codon:yes gene_type:complete
MIYKFKDVERESTLELEKRDGNIVEISVKFDYDDDVWRNIFLNKEDVFKLIGALHLIQKEL